MKHILTIIILGLSFSAIASLETRPDPGGWVSRDGSRVPNRDNMKSVNGFGGWLVVTPDKDWEQKWETPPENIPHFSEASEVSYGEQLTILTFYINPKLNDAGEFNLSCDIKVTRPDGSFSINAKDYDCGSGKLMGNPRNIRLAPTVIKYIGESGDLPGKWIVEVNIIDNIRRTKIPLKTSFNLGKEKANKQLNSDGVKNTPPVN